MPTMISRARVPPIGQPFVTDNHNLSQTRTALLLCFAFLAFLFFFKSYPARTGELYHREFTGKTYPRVAKASMLYGTDNNLYERALRSHRFHDERHDYPFYVLRHELTNGYWNKPSYLLSLVVNELAKPPGQRIEWIMWVDADLVLINPSVPLEVFLPPFDFPDIHFLGNKDQNGLNTGTFFLHVHEWSVKMLTKSIAFPMFNPNVDLHTSVDQEAMQHVFNETDFSSNVLFQPRIWYNTYEWHHAYEGKMGNLLVHFPGLEEDRWKHMNDWLITIEQNPTRWDVSLEKTMYPNETTRYWDTLRAAQAQLYEAEKMLGLKGALLDPRVQPAWEKTKRAVLFEADSLEAVERTTVELRLTLEQVVADELARNSQQQPGQQGQQLQEQQQPPQPPQPAQQQ